MTTRRISDTIDKWIGLSTEQKPDSNRVGSYFLEEDTNDVFIKLIDGWYPIGSALGIGDHGDLTGLADDDHLQYFPVNASRNLTGSLFFEDDQVWDIGEDGNHRPFNVFVGGTVQAQTLASLGSTQVFDTLILGNASDVKLFRTAAQTLRIGGPNVAVPSGYTITVGESSRSGTDNNVGGGSSTIRTGLGTGTGTAASILFQTPTLAASGSGAQSYTTRLTIATTLITSTIPVQLPIGDTTTPALRIGTNAGFIQGGINREIIFTSNGVHRMKFGQGRFELPSGGMIVWHAADDLTVGDLTVQIEQVFGTPKGLQLSDTTTPGPVAMYLNGLGQGATNYERLAFVTALGDNLIKTEAGGTGTLRGIVLGASAGKLGFFGTTAIAKPTVSGSKGGNVALAALVAELANLGLIVDGTS